MTVKPFDVASSSGRLLHQLEFVALSVCFLTFWSGLLFFLGHKQPETMSQPFLIFVSVCIVIGNVLFLTLCVFEFVKEFVNDFRNKAKMARDTKRKSELERELKMLGGRVQQGGGPQQAVQIVPVARAPGAVATEADGATEGSDNTFFARRRTSASFVRRQTSMKATALQTSLESNKEELKKHREHRQAKMRRRTALRIAARKKLLESRRLRKVEIFSGLDDEQLGRIVDKMSCRTFKLGDKIVAQGDPANAFFIVTEGAVSVWQRPPTPLPPPSIGGQRPAAPPPPPPAPAPPPVMATERELVVGGAAFLMCAACRAWRQTFCTSAAARCRSSRSSIAGSS